MGKDNSTGTDQTNC